VKLLRVRFKIPHEDTSALIYLLRELVGPETNKRTKLTLPCSCAGSSVDSLLVGAKPSSDPNSEEPRPHTATGTANVKAKSPRARQIVQSVDWKRTTHARKTSHTAEAATRRTRPSGKPSASARARFGRLALLRSSTPLRTWGRSIFPAIRTRGSGASDRRDLGAAPTALLGAGASHLSYVRIFEHGSRRASDSV
jgi:hypothetical protein